MPVVCLAGLDIASQFKDLRRAFEDIGWEVVTYVSQRPDSPIIEPDAYHFVGADHFPRLLRKNIKGSSFPAKVVNFGLNRFRNSLVNSRNESLLKELVQKCDLFIFIWSSFKSDYSDLEYIKSQGKKIGFIFCGDDARWYYGMKQEFEELGLPPVEYGPEYNFGTKGLRIRLQRIRSAEKYADFIFSKREQAQLQLRPFYHFPMCVYPQDYQVNAQQREVDPVVVHAPSHTSVKGTKYVLAAFDQLKEEGLKFTPVLLKDKSHQEAKEIYSYADIVIDQLFLPGGGKLSTEALASGKVVLGKMAYGVYEQGYPIHECPIVDIGVADVAAQLKRVISDYPLRKELAARAREYVWNYLSVQGLVNKMVSLYQGNEVPFDYIPDFFQSKYVPESKAALEEINYWNRYVRNTNWYKGSVVKKISHGIVF